MKTRPRRNPLLLAGSAEDRQTPRVLQIDDLGAREQEVRVWLHGKDSDGWVLYVSLDALRTWVGAEDAKTLRLEGFSPNRRTARVLERAAVPGEAGTVRLWMHPPDRQGGLSLVASRAAVSA